MPRVNFVGSLYKTHAALCSKIADVYGIEVREVRIWKFGIFCQIGQFLLHMRIL